MIRVDTLNLNHRTQAKASPVPLIEVLGSLNSDVLVLTEYVEGIGRKNLYSGLAGFSLLPNSHDC